MILGVPSIVAPPGGDGLLYAGFMVVMIKTLCFIDSECSLTDFGLYI
jgi:hypothetical protein